MLANGSGSSEAVAWPPRAPSCSTASRRAIPPPGNVDFESHCAALAACGDGTTPALRDGSRVHVGRDAVLAALDVLARDTP